MTEPLKPKTSTKDPLRKSSPPVSVDFKEANGGFRYSLVGTIVKLKLKQRLAGSLIRDAKSMDRNREPLYS